MAAASAALEAVERVRAIHQPLDAVMFAGRGQYPRRVCTGCGTDDGNWQIWPCPTIRALDGAATRDDLLAPFEALARDWEQRGEYGDASLTEHARVIRNVLADIKSAS